MKKLLALIVILGSISAQASAVTVALGRLVIQFDQNVWFIDQWPAFPFQFTHSAVGDWGSISTAEYDLGSDRLRWDFSASYSSSANGSLPIAGAYGYVNIVVGEPTPYELSGTWAHSGGSPQASTFRNQMHHSVSLLDNFENKYVIYHEFYTRSAGRTSIVSGEGTSGILLPGRTYQLSYYYYVEVGDYASEFTGYAGLGGSGAGFLEIEFGTACPSDLNGDGEISAADLAVLLGAWGPCASCAADINSDGVVNAADLGGLLGAWGACP